MTMTVHVDIVSAEKEIFSGLAEMIFAPAELGEIGITPRHAPLITKLNPGEVRVKVSSTESYPFFISGGLLEVQPHVVTIFFMILVYGFFPQHLVFLLWMNLD